MGFFNALAMAVSNAISFDELDSTTLVEARITNIEKIISYSWIGDYKPIIVPGEC